VRRVGVLLTAAFCGRALAEAQAPEPPPPDDEPVSDEGSFAPPKLQIHGFVSQGAFVSTANDYIGDSSNGSIELFEAGLNVSSEVADRLRAGVQLFGRNVGDYDDDPPRIDWAYLDYRWKPWLGVRAGIIKMPLGLYNEYADVDSARVPILLPQSVYSLRNRSALLAHTGFAVYGSHTFGGAGSLDYQTWFGTLNVPKNALVVSDNASVDSIDTKYVTGTQVFWNTPLEGLRVGGTYLRASIDFNISLDDATTQLLIMAGLVPPDFDGKIVVSQRPTSAILGSVEYTRGDWMFVGEYGRFLTHQPSSLPMLVPTVDEHEEKFYVMATRRMSRCLELGAYYSVFHVDADDRRGRDKTRFPERHFAFQRDAALSLRYDVNEHWLWKAEAHFIDCTADLYAQPDAKPERYWGLFLVRTTVTF
jgi:hypothetical protein